MVFVIAQRKLDQQLFVYSKNSQSSEVYLGQLVDAQMVEIGPIGDVAYVKDMTVSNEQLFGKPVVLVSGLYVQNGRDRIEFTKLKRDRQLIESSGIAIVQMAIHCCRKAGRTKEQASP